MTRSPPGCRIRRESERRLCSNRAGHANSYRFIAVSSLAPPLGFSVSSGGLMCAGVASGILGGAGLCVLIRDLLRAPEAYEDETGFHVIRRKAAGEKKETRR